MIRNITITNFKSIPHLTVELGRVNVLIGANGSGKSNILEALAFASAASQDKLDHEFLASRGIRVTEQKFMRSAFATFPSRAILEKPFPHSRHTRDWIDEIVIAVQEDKVHYVAEIREDLHSSFPQWTQNIPLSEEVLQNLRAFILPPPGAEITKEQLVRFGMRLYNWQAESLANFLIYAPEISALRTFQAETQILPLGIRGEGLFAHLKALNSPKYSARLDRIKELLSMIEWFEDFKIPQSLSPGERTILIRDHFLAEGALFSQISANEGFLFLLFYLTAMISPDTPKFFAIDNVDNSLNPKLCTALMKLLVRLAAENDRQLILTTHNPTVLDGLDLDDDDQRLFVVDRNPDGHTRMTRVPPFKPVNGAEKLSLSQAFVRGFIGGLPSNF